MSVSEPNILEAGVLALVVPELKDYWHPTRLEDFHYIRPELREQYLKALERRADYCERRIGKEPSMRQDWLAISALADQLREHVTTTGQIDRFAYYLADELVRPMTFEKDELVVAFDDLTGATDGRTHLGPLYLAKVMVEKIDLEMMLIGPANGDLPANERGRLPTIQGMHVLSYAWAMHYGTFEYYYRHRSAIDSHLRLLAESDVGIAKNSAGVSALTALKRHFETQRVRS